MKHLLYLKDEQIKDFIQLISYAYRETFSDPKEILAREIKAYMEGPVKENRAMGELDHPESSVINLQNVYVNLIKYVFLKLNYSFFN